MTTKIGYYPGCALTKGSSSAEYGMSVKKVAEALDINLVEIGDWNCCGASTAHQTNHLLALSLSARNIAMATKEGFEDLLVPCPACSLRFITAQKELSEDAELRKKIEDNIEMPYNDNIKVLNYLEFVKKYCVDKLESKVRKKPEIQIPFFCFANERFLFLSIPRFFARQICTRRQFDYRGVRGCAGVLICRILKAP
mgnify:CR=1 FL=1